MANITIYATPENKSIIIKTIEKQKAGSYWKRGVKEYAIDLIDGIDEGAPINEKTLLNGAENWSAYSHGGSSLVYDYDIAKTLCTPSELKRTRDGELPPSNGGSWIDVQAEALRQAAKLIRRIVNNLKRQSS